MTLIFSGLAVEHLHRGVAVLVQTRQTSPTGVGDRSVDGEAVARRAGLADEAAVAVGLVIDVEADRLARERLAVHVVGVHDDDACELFAEPAPFG